MNTTANNRLNELENKSVYIIREAFSHYPRLAMLWSIGKDSSCLLWLIRKAFMGEIPFPVMHIDTSYKFPEMYRHRDKWAKKWGLNLIICRNDKALASGMSPEKNGRLACCGALKTEALQNAIQEHGFDALLVGIRRDEHGVRAKERVFSPRDDKFHRNYTDQPMEIWEQYQKGNEEKRSKEHFRIHPLLDWTEFDIWTYTQREKIPINELYFSKKGKRYRSLGCTHCTQPLDSNANTVDKIVEEIRVTKIAERAGRAQDKESAYMMQKLRSLGYM